MRARAEKIKLPSLWSEVRWGESHAANAFPGIDEPWRSGKKRTAPPAWVELF